MPVSHTIYGMLAEWSYKFSVAAYNYNHLNFAERSAIKRGVDVVATNLAIRSMPKARKRHAGQGLRDKI